MSNQIDMAAMKQNVVMHFWQGESTPDKREAADKYGVMRISNFSVRNYNSSLLTEEIIHKYVRLKVYLKKSKVISNNLT